MLKQKQQIPVLRLSKPAVVAICLLLIGFSMVAQVFTRPVHTQAATNETINFQARLLTASGSLVSDGTYNVEFKLYGASSGGSALWTETRTSGNRVRVVNGYLTVNLGSVASFPNTINWDQELWMTMNIGGITETPDWDGEMNPRLKLTAVPFAKRAGELAGGTGANTTRLTTGTPSGNNILELPAESGTLCVRNSSQCGFMTTASGVQLQPSTPGTPQTGNFNVTGTGIIGTALSTPIVDNAGTLSLGTTSATSVSLGRASINTTVTGSNIYLTGNTTVTSGNTFSVQSGWASITGLNTANPNPTLTINSHSSGASPLVVQSAGTTVFTVANGGAATFQNASDSTSGFMVKNTGNVSVVNVDTTNQQLTVGSNTSTNRMQLLVNQAGTADTGMEFKNPNISYYAGIDTSAGDVFKISSSAAGGTAVLGYNPTNGGGSTDSNSRNFMAATMFTATSTGTITTINAHIGATVGGSPNNQGQAAIYTNSGGTPGARLGTTPSITLVANSWNTYTLSSPVNVTNGTTYWLVTNNNGTATSHNNVTYDGGTTNQTKWSAQTFGSWPSSWTTTNYQDNWKLAMYATINVSSSADPLNNGLFSLTASGQALFKNNSNSTTAFQVQNAAGTSLFTVDTATPQVSVNTTTNIQGSSAGSLTALTVNTGAASNKGLVVRGAASQSDNLIDVQNSSSTTLFKVKSDGATVVGQDAGGTAALQVNNGSFTGASVGILVRGHASQTGDMLRLQDASANTLFKVDADGDTTIARSMDIQYQSGATNQLTIQGPSGAFVTVNTNQNKFYVGGTDVECSGRFCVYQNVGGTGGSTYRNLYNATTISATTDSIVVNQDIVVTDTSATAAHTLRGIRIDMSASTNQNASYNPFLIKLPSTTSTSVFGGNAMQIQNGSTNIFRLTNVGAALFQNTLNSTSAFSVQNAAGNSLLTIDTSGNNATFGSTAAGINAIQMQTVTGQESNLSFQSGSVLSGTNIKYAFSKRSDNTSFWNYAYDGTTYWNMTKADWTNKYYSLVPDGIGSVGIGTATPSRLLDVRVNNGNVAALPLLVQQAGATGDVGIELKNTTHNYYIGIDNSDSDAFKISSNLSGGTSRIWGYDQIGAEPDSGMNNGITGSMFKPRTTGAVTTLYAYVEGPVSAAPNNKGQMAIYTNSSGLPGTKLASSGDTVLTAGTWVAFTIPSTNVTAGTTYWLTYNTNGTSGSNNVLTYDEGPIAEAFYTTTTVTYGTWPTTYSTPSTVVNRRYSMYSIVTPTTQDNFEGADLLRLSSTGALQIQSIADTDSAFSVLSADGTTLMNLDGITGALRLAGTGTNQSNGRLYFGDWDFAYIGEYGDYDSDSLALYGADGLFMGTEGNTEAIVIDLDGLVGIGTSSPSQALTVVGNIQVNNATTATKAYRVRTSGGSIDMETAAANLYISTFSDIAMTAPNQKNHIILQTDGNMRFMSIPTLTASIRPLCIDSSTKYVQYGTTNGGSCAPSSSRFKKNIASMNDAMGLEAISALRPVTFQYISGADQAQKMGFIAEEMEKILPQAVGYDEQGRPAGIDYGMLTANLVKGMQQQQVQINSLRQGLWDGGIVSRDTTFNGYVTFNSNVAFKGEATFDGKVGFNGKLTYNPDTAGTVVVPKGQTTVVVKFAQPYDQTPQVTLSSSEYVSLKIIDKRVDGFTIKMKYAANSDVSIDWVATQVATPTINTAGQSNAPTVVTSGP